MLAGGDSGEFARVRTPPSGEREYGLSRPAGRLSSVESASIVAPGRSALARTALSSRRAPRVTIEPEDLDKTGKWGPTQETNVRTHETGRARQDVKVVACLCRIPRVGQREAAYRGRVRTDAHNS